MKQFMNGQTMSATNVKANLQDETTLHHIK